MLNVWVASQGETASKDEDLMEYIGNFNLYG